MDGPNSDFVQILDSIINDKLVIFRSRFLIILIRRQSNDINQRNTKPTEYVYRIICVHYLLKVLKSQWRSV